MNRFLFNKDYPIWIPLIIGAAFRLINISSPLLGVHSWRQADTAAMARNFANNATPIWLPQVDWGGATGGYVECEFPLYPYIVAQIYRVFGVHDSIGRYLSVLFSLITIYIVICIGRKIFDPISGWWAGIFLSFLPLSVYYGRTFQPEALLILLAAISIDRMIAWKNNRKIFNLYISWFSFCLACLIKVLPFIWLGAPLFFIASCNSSWTSTYCLQSIYDQIRNCIRNLYVYIFSISALFIAAIWFYYSYHLGQETGITFGFWGQSSDRSSLSMLLDVQNWLDFSMRISIRNLSIIGIPIVILGTLRSYKTNAGLFLISGLLGVFVCNCFAFRSSLAHEYYQLPFQLFFSLLMGKGFSSLIKELKLRRIYKSLKISTIIIITSISLTVVYYDYYLLENRQSDVWIDFANRIKKEVPVEAKIVSVSGDDPTLLNLARRSGWVVHIKDVNYQNLLRLKSEGANYLIGSKHWVESYNKTTDSEKKYISNILRCNDISESNCSYFINENYIIPFSKLFLR